MGSVSPDAPESRRIGSRSTAYSSTYAPAATSPNQNATALIWPAERSSCFPSARDSALAPPTPKRFEIAVSIRNDGYATVTAAVCAGRSNRPMKYVSAS